MVLPLASALAGALPARRRSGVALLLVVVTALSATALAQDQRESFSATVKVDATADTAAAARELARIDGQRRALGLLIDRLSGSSDNAKLGKLDDKTITDLVQSFEVANERMSAVRYLGDYTFHFRPAKIRRMVHIADSAPADGGTKPAPPDGGSKPAVPETGGKPIVVLPVYKDAARTVLWDDPNTWRDAWGQRSGDTGAVHLTVPLGDASDLATIDASRAEAGKSEALAAIAQQNGADEAVVALATPRRQGERLVGLDVSLKRYRAGRLADAQTTTVDAIPEESENAFLRRAAEMVAAGVAQKNPRTDQPATLAASVPISSLGEWVQVRDRLASVAAVRKVDLLSLSRQEAKIQIRYVGSADQLKSSLAEVDLGLGGGDPVWQLQISGATSLR